MKQIALFLVLLLAGPALSPAIAEEKPAVAEPVVFSQETLPNGLRVIYSPLHQAPVVHVRVLYHVGSRDERPDRQGFAHMFEHMMFRGSAHVAPQEHMKRIDEVGGISNAFTSFDETVYVNTIPSEYLETALYLEADRMSSFKVSDQIYQTERKVVAEEWRMRQNRPYGNVFDDLFKTAFTTHSYRWTPIGNMDHLLAAPSQELQEFFNTYYIPNNAVLVIAGDIDVEAAKKMVHRYFAWIPAGAPIAHRPAPEAPQTQPRAATVPDRLVPLPQVVIAYHLPPFRSDDQYPLSVLSAILGEGVSSRLYRLLVASDKPLCYDASTIDEALEDGGVIGVAGRVLNGQNADAVKAALAGAVADIVAHGVSAEEVAKAKTLRRVEMVNGRETAEEIAGQLGDEALFADDPGRINTDMARLDAVTAEQVQAVAARYMTPEQSTTLVVMPDPLGVASRKNAGAAAAISLNAPVAVSSQPVVGRDVHFPDDYPKQAPTEEPRSAASFAKGQETSIDGVKVIVMPDHRLPLVNFSLTLRRGSHSDPPGKEGLASLTADMLRRGAGKLSFQQMSEELESHGISLGASDGGDFSRLSGSCTSDQLDRAFARLKDLLREPTFPADEFEKLKRQQLNALSVAQESASTVAEWDMARLLYGDSPLGRRARPASVAAISLEDVKNFFRQNYVPDGAVLIIAGDVSPEDGQRLATALTEGWSGPTPPPVDYQLPSPPTGKTVLLVDRPGAKGASIRMAMRAYDLHDDQKFAGTLAGAILSSGIESRLGVYVRAQKGYVYGVNGTFQPNRHAGAFVGLTETKPETTADTIEAMFKVFRDVREGGVTSEELAAAKRRVIGSMIMTMQTIAQQAQLRVDGILNGYPIDYFDVYPAKVSTITAEQVKAVVVRYVRESDASIVIVGPADQIKDRLLSLGSVKVLPMPAKRGTNATTQPTDAELLKPSKQKQ